MKVITREDMARSTAERFYKQYGPAFGIRQFGDSRKVYDALVALGDNPTVSAVEEICNGWTLLTCNECKRYVEAVVQVGEVPDYESDTASICQSCAHRARTLIDAVASSDTGDPGHAYTTVETTNQETEKFATHACSHGPFKNGREAFNALSPMPETVDLGDGRVLSLRVWTPSATSVMYGGLDLLDVSIQGFIRLNPKKQDEVGK